MKTMTCNQLGGPASCSEEFHANTWQEMGEKSKNHAMENINDKDHKEAMNKMSELMKNPEAMQKWMDERKQEFDALPED